MGLGRLNPGCRQECGCEGCFGILEQLGPCKIKWAVSGDPFYVELLLDGNLVSNAETGELHAPQSGTYTLKVRCAESDGLSTIETLIYLFPPTGCSSCCQAVGAPNIFLDTVTVDVSMSGLPWSWFNGSYVLSKSTNQGLCRYQADVSQPRGAPGIWGGSDPNPPSRCRKFPGANLYLNGYYAGLWTQATPHGQLVYEVWYLPWSLTAVVVLGDPGYSQEVPILTTSFQRLDVSAVMLVALVAVDQITSPPASRSCTLFSFCGARIRKDVLCGNATVFKNYETYTFNPGLYTPAIEPTGFTATVFP